MKAGGDRREDAPALPFVWMSLVVFSAAVTETDLRGARVVTSLRFGWRGFGEGTALVLSESKSKDGRKTGKASLGVTPRYRRNPD